MSETTELKRDKLSEWFRQQIEPLLDQEYERGKADALPTPPAIEPSEQPNAEDAEALTAIIKGIRDMFWSAYRDGCDSAHDTFTRTQVDKMCDDYIEDRFEVVETLVQSYARHTAAKAVCPHIWSGDDGTSHCQLAAANREMIDKEVELAVEAERQRLADHLNEADAGIREEYNAAVTSLAAMHYRQMLVGMKKAYKEFRSWLAGEGEKP